MCCFRANRLDPACSNAQALAFFALQAVGCRVASCQAESDSRFDRFTSHRAKDHVAAGTVKNKDVGLCPTPRFAGKAPADWVYPKPFRRFFTSNSGGFLTMEQHHRQQSTSFGCGTRLSAWTAIRESRMRHSRPAPLPNPTPHPSSASQAGSYRRRAATRPARCVEVGIGGRGFSFSRFAEEHCKRSARLRLKPCAATCEIACSHGLTSFAHCGKSTHTRRSVPSRLLASSRCKKHLA
jgi:hypothetical protein